MITAAGVATYDVSPLQNGVVKTFDKNKQHCLLCND